MNKPKEYAIEAAKEITVSALSGNPNVDPWQCGETVAEFFETVYNKVLEIAKDIQETEG